MLSNFCSCHWQLQKVQNITKTEPVKWQPKHVSLIAGSRCHEAPTLPRVAWVSTRLPTQVSAFQNRVKEFNFTRLTPHVSRWHCNAPAILVGVLLQSPPFSAGVHQTNVTSLSCLPTGPFSPGQEKKKVQKKTLLHNNWTVEGNNGSSHTSTNHCTCSHRGSHQEEEEKYNFNNKSIFSTPKVSFWGRGVKYSTFGHSLVVYSLGRFCMVGKSGRITATFIRQLRLL